jgi:hypothetical protein
MGNTLENSRTTLLPEDIDSRECELQTKWHETHTQDDNNTFQKMGEATLGKNMLVVGDIINNFLLGCKIKDLKILEVMAGNCVASLMLDSKINDKVESWVRTDIGDYSDKSKQMDSIAAVENYGDESNLLLIISPPPGTLDSHSGAYFGDYFACKKFIETKKEENKYIIFVGELGASDGTEGMYLYMTEHPRLELLRRQLIFRRRQDAFGGPLEKEVFLFLIK